MQIKNIVVLFVLLIMVVSSLAVGREDLEKLEKITKAIRAHREMIKTGEGEVASYRKDFRTGTTAERRGKWWFKDGVWRFDCEDFQWNPAVNPDGTLKAKTIRKAELRDEILLDFVSDVGAGSIRKNLITGIMGLYLMGITGITRFAEEDDYLKKIEKIEKAGLTYHLRIKEDVEFAGKRCILIELDYPIDVGHSYEQIWVSPEQQYSLIHYRSWLVMDTSGRPGNGVINDVKMKYIDPPGIWFPEEAIFRDYISFPQTLIREERYVFSNTRLNIPITDEQMSIRLPPGSRIANMINKKNYYLRREATLEDILSGKIKSEEEKRAMPVFLREVLGPLLDIF